MAIALLGILFAVALPSFSTWIANTRVRTVSDALQNGLRVAQAEALRRNRQVVFSLTNAQPALNAAAAANGRNWSVQTVAQFGDAAEFVQGGALSDLAANVAINGPVAVCFGSSGRLVANNSAATTGVPNATCLASGAQYDVSLSSSDRALRVMVALGGQVRMCDPKRPSTEPDGCR